LSAANDVESTVWRLTPGQALRRRGWDGEHLLYNDLSGDTHLLAEPAILLLLALQQQARPQAALAPLAGFPDSAPDAADAIDALLADLEALSLVECVAC
jgi:PqqD family protein of HPr-rel-A system